MDVFKFLLNFIPGVGPFLSSAFSGFGSFIAKHWKAFLVILMIGTIAYQNFSPTRFVFFVNTIPYLEHKMETQQAEIKSLHSDLMVAARANAMLVQEIKNNNATVQQWMNISKKLQNENNKLAVTIKHMNESNAISVNKILNGKTPTSCKASIQYLKNMGKKLKW
jgi:predicted PurR-regulated permease PerM